MYPLDDGHLLTIGREASAEGFTQGISLSIFDVTNPASPALAHRYVYEGDAYSSAEADHRAITFHPEGGRIAFPLQNWQTGASSLEVFDVSATAGFDRARRHRASGARDHVRRVRAPARILRVRSRVAAPGDRAYPEYEESFLSQCRYQEQMRRGVLREDVAFAITTAGVYAHSVDALGGDALGQAALPPSYYYYGYLDAVPMMGVGGGAFVGGAGSSGAPMPSADAGAMAGAGGAAGSSSM